jgi:acyl carrier protein
LTLGSVKELIRKEIVAQSLVDDHPPADNEDLFGAGFLDSLAFLGILAFIQNKFGVSFARTDIRYENFSTIQAIADRVEKQLKA